MDYVLIAHQMQNSSFMDTQTQIGLVISTQGSRHLGIYLVRKCYNFLEVKKAICSGAFIN